jgi:hypothetical protein
MSDTRFVCRYCGRVSEQAPMSYDGTFWRAVCACGAQSPRRGTYHEAVFVARFPIPTAAVEWCGVEGDGRMEQ